MKLHYVEGSPNCRRALATVYHLGIEVDIEYMDFFSGDLRKPAYVKLNPNAMVPTLQDGDFVLWESNAIMQYLADRTPGNTLFPQDPRTRADIVRWQCWGLAHYNKAFGMLSFETLIKPNFLKAEPDAALVKWATAELALHLRVLESHLKGRDYAVGDGITLADYSLVQMQGFKAAMPFDWSPYPNVNAYYDRIAAVPHWARTEPGNAGTGRRPAAPGN